MIDGEASVAIQKKRRKEDLTRDLRLSTVFSELTRGWRPPQTEDAIELIKDSASSTCQDRNILTLTTLSRLPRNTCGPCAARLHVCMVLARDLFKATAGRFRGRKGQGRVFVLKSGLLWKPLGQVQFLPKATAASNPFPFLLLSFFNIQQRF